MIPMTTNLDAIALALPYMPGVAILLNRNLIYLGVTTRYAELMRQPLDFFPGKSFYDVPILGNVDCTSIFDILLHNREEKIPDIKFRTKAAELTYVCQGKAVMEVDEQVSGLVLSLENEPRQDRVFNFDLAKNTHLEDHLYQNDERFRQAFEHSLIGMALVSTSGKWLRANESLCQILGYTEHELQQMTIQELTHPEDLDKSVSLLSGLGDGSQGNIKLEKRYIHKDGSVVWVMLASTMLKDRKGGPLYYVSHMENITNRKEIEDNLILSEAKYRTIFENVQDVFYQTNMDGYVTEISPSIKLYSGYGREEVIGRPVSDFYYYEDDRNRIVELLKLEGAVIDFEVRLKTRDDQLKYASVNARMIQDQGGQTIIEGSMRDVTTRKFQENALKALNAELQESNEQKSKLLSIIGHDLRNPISGSLQLLDLTLMDYESSSATEVHTYLSKMKQELSNANALLEDLLTWAKAQFNVFNFNPVYTDDLGSMVRNCVEKILPMAINKGVGLFLNIEQGLGITADVGMLETIVRNLVSNAIKFSVKGDEIILSAFKVDGLIQFSVKDQGLGIAADKLEQLFNKNVNYTTYGTSGEKGTGLGLSICYDFVAKHGGELWVESTVGEGSTFHFSVPQPQ